MKSFIILILYIAAYFTSTAQITKVEIQASGLTCSMCSKSINKSLNTITYISKVEVDLNKNIFTITFKDSAKIELDELKKKVEVAGYTVAKMWVNLQVSNITVKNDAHLDITNSTYHFMNIKEQQLNGNIKVQVLDKGFVSKKEYKKNNEYTTMSCYKTGYMESCCNLNKKAKTRIYHVTI